MVNQLEPADLYIAMVFQNYALYPHMTVFKNMAYGLKIRRMPKEEIEKRVQKAAQILELTEFLDRKPRQLSGGQRQRVAMGKMYCAGAQSVSIWRAVEQSGCQAPGPDAVGNSQTA